MGWLPVYLLIVNPLALVTQRTWLVPELHLCCSEFILTGASRKGLGITKVSGGKTRSDCIYDGSWLMVRGIIRPNGSSPALDWKDGLQEKGKGQLLAACQVMETTLRSGRPSAGRAEPIKNSKVSLCELKVTKPGSKPPHLRALYVRRGRTLWIADGLTKQKNTISASDCIQAESIVAEWVGDADPKK